MISMPSAGQQILVVDDNPFIASMLQQGLATQGYESITAGNGLMALDIIKSHPPDLVLLDLDLPKLRGDELCRLIKANPATRLIPVVMITAMSAAQNKIAAWDYGADDFVSKPFHLVEVLARIRSLLRIKRLVEERDSAEAVVFALARTVEAKSPFTAGHSERVTRLALELARAAGVPAEELEVLRKGALLHDLGKISIPDAILNKPSRLTPSEYDLVKQHPIQGAHIVEPLVSVRDAAPLIRWHHERLDGKGYPDGLRGEEIHRLVRILSVCDVYDSLSSDRPYRERIPTSACLDMLRENALGGGLDLELVTLFTEISLQPEIAPSRSALLSEV